MSITGSGPGKTAPKLFHDFLLFDPLKTNPNANYLTDHTPSVGDGVQLAPQIASCKHDYTTKWNQSITPPLDIRPDGGSQYKVAVVCKKCRIHADVHLAFAGASNPCPNSDYPLHHFQRVPTEDRTTADRIVYAWQCSAPECRAQLQTIFKAARISPDIKQLLTSPELLKSRYEAVVREDPTRDGLRQCTPIEALTRLRKYIKDSLNMEHERRTFPANNKRFMEAFGVNGRDCAEVLQSMGFRFTVDPETEQPMWTLPQPPVIEDRLGTDGNSLREFLEDVEVELRAWMYKLASEGGSINPAAQEGWPSADREVERTLAAQGYQRHSSSLRRTDPSNEELPYSASLGAQPDFADSLIEFAFDRQALCDPPRRAYYFECLQVITESRGTEQLQMKVATLESQDLVSRRDLSAAFRQLNIPVSEVQHADDNRILNLFQAQQIDLGSQSQECARQALYKIGVSRQSQRLINASRQTLKTYDDAITWLGNGVDQSSSDDGLLAVVAMKIEENKENEALAHKAVSIIAKERKSNFLNSWLLNGRADGYQMSVDEALRHLGIDSNFSELDQSVLPAVLESARADRPGEQTDKAIFVVQQAMAGNIPSFHSPETWPVGLTSHGNTCYLNSLLQYYFSIAPLRDIILNYDQYKLDTEKYSQKDERVGQRKISMVEIKGGQRFAEDLKHLFERMIKDPGEHVKPEEDLVCRAFLEPKDYALLASAIKEEAAAVSAKPDSLENAVDEKLTEEPSNMTPAESDASSITLQASVNGDDTDIPMKSGDPPPTPPASPGLGAKPEPTTAPPLPPRRFSTTKEEALEKAHSNARQQQDVTEVHDGIMFRLRSGMMPQGKDASEEQDDALRDLFKISLVETAVKDDVDGKKKELSDSSIQLNVPTEATDIYSALDAFFDLQAYDEDSQKATLETYKSIRDLPPVLQVNIPRIGFDKTGRGGAYKSEACLKLEDELYLDRYTDRPTDTGSQVLPKRKACWGWRKQLHALRKEQKALSATQSDLDGPSAVTETAKFLDRLADVNADLDLLGVEGIDMDPELPRVLNTDAEIQTQRLASLDKEIAGLEKQIKDQFEDMKDLRYRLAAVFFHRGSYGHGHYWIYIHDFEKDMWRSYNDERVEEFQKLNEIFEANNWNHGTPTYAVYVREDEKSDIVKPVCRAPEKPPTPDPNQWTDVEMQNGQDQLPALVYEGVEPREKQPEGIDPKLTYEGGASRWDEPRRVPIAKW